MVKCVAMKDQNLINTQKTKRSWLFSILLHNIIILLVLFLIYGCDNIYSVYNTKIINNEKICVHTYLESNYSRRFLKSLKENPHINEMPNCDYLLVVAIEGDYNTVNNVAGVRLENKVKLNAKYSLFKYEDNKYHQVKDILENPTIRSFEQYTSNKNASLSKGRSLATNEKVERTFDSAGLREIYKTTKVYNSISYWLNVDDFSISEHTGKTSQGESVNSIHIKDSRYVTVSDFLNGVGNESIVYELAEPIHYSFTSQQLLTFKGENNIWSDTNGQTEVKFWTH